MLRKAPKESDVTIKKKSKLGHKLVLGVRGVLVGLGLVSSGTHSFASSAFDAAASENTVESYTSFILGGGNVDDVDEAFCRLRDLDEASAGQVARQFSSLSEVASVDFDTCASTGSARLIII